jgi:acyl-CoA reductase-like NAD-dependent aldehyde dehydrogenase
MTIRNVAAPVRRWSAEELRRLPAAQRSEILRAAAELAAIEYETDPQLTAFEAFGEDDLYVDSSNSETE